jgi:hypothetical protein
MIRTFVDAGVLIAAARGVGTGAEAAKYSSCFCSSDIKLTIRAIALPIPKSQHLTQRPPAFPKKAGGLRRQDFFLEG